MKKIIKPRQAGKTTDLIEISEKTGVYILTANRNRAECVFRMAQEQNRNIPFPVTLWDYQKTGFRGSFINHILIDDAEEVLHELFRTVQIDALTMTSPGSRHCEAMCHKFKDVPASGTYVKHLCMNWIVAAHALTDFFAHFIHGIFPFIKIKHHQPVNIKKEGSGEV